MKLIGNLLELEMLPADPRLGGGDVTLRFTYRIDTARIAYKPDTKELLELLAKQDKVGITSMPKLCLTFEMAREEVVKGKNGEHRIEVVTKPLSVAEKPVISEGNLESGSW